MRLATLDRPARMNRVAVAAMLIAAAGCTSVESRADREVLPRILGSVVQLRAELEGDNRRSGSGIVIKSDPDAVRCWIITTRHLLEPTRPRRVVAALPGRGGPLETEIVQVATDVDLAILSLSGVAPPAVTLKDVASLGQEVWVVGFPWGRRLTVVRGVVSQLVADPNELRLEGPVRMVDASVSYGASGGGVFEVSTGALVGIVEGYRTARVSLPQATESVLHIPVPGETTVVSAAGIRRFLSSAGLAR